jgi:hypothetical protein
MVCVSGAYEAAAELLAAPSAALVLDLGLLWPRHFGLLRVAREMGAEMLAFGTAVAGVDSEQLTGVRLVSRARLPERLAELARQPALTERPIPAQEPELEEEPAQAREIPASHPLPAARLVSAKKSPAPPWDSNERAESPPVDLALEGDDGEQQVQKQPEVAAPPAPRTRPEHASEDGSMAHARATLIDPGSLLTPEELSALLGEGGK